MIQTAMTIGTMAQRAGVHPRTLRYYERIGLLVPSARTAAGYRLYTAADEERLHFIRRAQRTGLSLAEIGGILALRQGGTVPCRHVCALAETKAEEIAQQMRELEQVRRELLHLAENARAVEPACSTATSAICLAFDDVCGRDCKAASGGSVSRP